MAVKFPLEMKDGVQVRNISELKENFDVEKVVGYFLDGKLKKWLDARWYEDESEEISKLDEGDPLLAQRLCEIFGVEHEEEKINPEEIAARNARISKLKQYTDDEEIINNVDAVAFDQEELADLYERAVEKIYLCEGEFKIPKSKMDLEYIMLGGAIIMNSKPEPDEYVYELRKKYIFDKKVEEIRKLPNGEKYNVVINCIVKINVKTKKEVQLTNDLENVEEFMFYDDRVIYTLRNNGDVWSRVDGAGVTKISQSSRNGTKLYFLDNKRAIWSVKDTYFMSDFDNEFKIYGANYIVPVTVKNDSFWFIINKTNTLCRVDLTKTIEKNKKENSWFYGISGEDFEILTVQKDVHFAGTYGDYIYSFRYYEGGRFYKINIFDMEPEYIANSGWYVGKMDVYKNFIIYVTCTYPTDSINVLNVDTREIVCLEGKMPTPHFHRYEIVCDDEWIYYTAKDFGGKYIVKNKVRYDGTDRQGIDLSGIPKTRNVTKTIEE